MNTLNDITLYPPYHLFTVPQTATLLSVSTATVYRLVRKGKLHPVDISTGKYLFAQAEILALITGGHHDERQ